MTEEQISYMADRFCGWKLPEGFNPDGGISFEPIANQMTPHPYRREPTGTNLLSHEQAKQMIRYMLEGLPKRCTSCAGTGIGIITDATCISCQGTGWK